jgi:DNA-binding winged helix-turn-helix (wHTH) protein
MKICFGDYALDLGTRLLSRSGATVHPSPKAFELLKLLVERRPNAVSKSELHQHIWPGTFVSDDSLSRLIVEVREAIDDDARKPRFVRTVHGFGYAFSADAEAVGDNQTDVSRASETGGSDRPGRFADERTEPRSALRWRAGALGLLAVAIFAATAVAIVFFHRSASAVPVRFIVAAPEGTAFSPSASFLAVSSDAGCWHSWLRGRARKRGCGCARSIR